MRLMHEHYLGLDDRKMTKWLTAPRDGGRVAELFGWFPEAPLVPDGPLLVLGITSRAGEAGREAVFAEYFGVAADALKDGDVAEDEIHGWYCEFVRMLRRLSPSGIFKSIRPKTMNYKPMQRVHDMVTEGTPVPDQGPGGDETLCIVVDEEHDRGTSLYWMLRIVVQATLPS
jgi:hypothetical protein